MQSSEVVSAAGYYPYGMVMDDRNYLQIVSEAYRYAFNGKEDDSEVSRTGQGTQDYGFRIYNTAIAKFLSVDPLTNQYPWNSPYCFAENGPIENIDLDGNERLHYTRVTDQEGNSKLVFTHAEDIVETTYQIVMFSIVPSVIKIELKNTRVEYVVHDKFLNPIAGKMSVKWQWYNEIAEFDTYEEAEKAKRSDFHEAGICWYCVQTGMEAVADEHRDGRAPGAASYKTKANNYNKRKVVFEGNKGNYPKVPLSESLSKFNLKDYKYSADGQKKIYENESYSIRYDVEFNYYKIFDKSKNQLVNKDGKVPNANAAGRGDDKFNYYREQTHILNE
jgi:RHS repeat-associated protein